MLRMLVIALLLAGPAVADIRELVPEAVLKQIAEETSGEEAKRNLDTLTLQHRMRASSQFDDATSHILRKLESYGLDEVSTLEYAADGKTMFGTQKSRPVWKVNFAELWELKDDGGQRTRSRRLASWEAVPLSLAQDSLSGEATTMLVDIGGGTADADYAGKDVRGKFVLTSSQPEIVVERAVGELGAAGIVSYAANQRSAWWKQDDRLVRWGHLSSFPKTKTFAFMVSLGEARRLQERMAGGEQILLHGKVDATHERGHYRFATARIKGADPQKSAEEILFTCHLDHPRPGANDNASGCVSILEVARTLNKLIDEGTLLRPARSIRFLWPAEIEGSIIFLSQHKEPSLIKANIHMDMVGGGPETKAVFRISGGPISLPTFISDLGFEVGRFVNEQSEAFAGGADVAFPLIATEGGKEPQLALMEGLDMGSDHDVFREGSWRIPGLYLHDWPDRYIHTNFDTAAMIDPTKLKRAAFIGAVNALFLAGFSNEHVPAVLAMLRKNALYRSAELVERLKPLEPADKSAVARVHFTVERRKIHSVESFAPLAERLHDEAADFVARLEALVARPAAAHASTNDTVYRRDPKIPGPMSGFGFDYMEDRYGADRYAQLRLPKYAGSHGSGGEYVYEALNFVDGKRTVSEIRDWLTAELGPVPVETVAEYLEALHSIGVINPVD
ncbi:MAG: DUF4910 domain-containing protein [Gammaproteobacteria bacterium]|nr:DUF4910 domain-containing protein [Gammaproteobacteria bacterium]MDH4314285.1 DUF4910 domain-containing protein [Gammaproteobacteria bacterium]MDH5212757.1 DUF4910 domain-containing protein [Gammaproteobacteria bacterium]MDH5499702.1 DUF4910 domain-containing protein [Gammaproteobacteria bacterium]